MKNTLIRIAIYIPIITAFYWILTPGAFDAIPFAGSFAAQAAGYIAYYGVAYAPWIAIYEGAYRLAKWELNRKPKPIPIPDTQPLSATTMNRRLARACNIDGSDPHIFALPKPQIIAKITDHPDGRATAELTDYGKSMLQPRTFEQWFKLMEPYFDIRLVPNVGIVTGKYYHEVLANQEDE